MTRYTYSHDTTIDADMITEIAQESGVSETFVKEAVAFISDRYPRIDDEQIFIEYVVEHIEYEISEGRGR